MSYTWILLSVLFCSRHCWPYIRRQQPLSALLVQEWHKARWKPLGVGQWQWQWQWGDGSNKLSNCGEYYCDPMKILSVVPSDHPFEPWGHSRAEEGLQRSCGGHHTQYWAGWRKFWLACLHRRLCWLTSCAINLYLCIALEFIHITNGLWATESYQKPALIKPKPSVPTTLQWPSKVDKWFRIKVPILALAFLLISIIVKKRKLWQLAWVIKLPFSFLGRLENCETLWQSLQGGANLVLPSGVLQGPRYITTFDNKVSFKHATHHNH